MTSNGEVPGDVAVEVVETVDATLLDAVNRLVPQLSSSTPALTVEMVERVVAAEACHLLVARDGADVLGMLTLVVFPIPTGVRAWIEDVVVDGTARGRGVGEALNRFALDLARSLGAKTVDLTSRPSREAANRLYRRIGFVARETNVYRYELSDRGRRLV
jgi:ribosomal protein S18 acetylase RimI-like enzyme